MQIFSNAGVCGIKRKARAVFHECRLCGWNGLSAGSWICWPGCVLCTVSGKLSGNHKVMLSFGWIKCWLNATKQHWMGRTVWLQNISLIQAFWLIFFPTWGTRHGVCLSLCFSMNKIACVQPPCPAQGAAVKSGCGLDAPQQTDYACWQSRVPGDSLYKTQISHPFSRCFSSIGRKETTDLSSGTSG